MAQKLHGIWVLLRLAGKESEWLLIKENDDFADVTHDVLDEDTSVISAKTIGDIKDGLIGEPPPGLDHQADVSARIKHTGGSSRTS